MHTQIYGITISSSSAELGINCAKVPSGLDKAV